MPTAPWVRVGAHSTLRDARLASAVDRPGVRRHPCRGGTQRAPLPLFLRIRVLTLTLLRGMLEVKSDIGAKLPSARTTKAPAQAREFDTRKPSTAPLFGDQHAEVARATLATSRNSMSEFKEGLTAAALPRVQGQV